MPILTFKDLCLDVSSRERMEPFWAAVLGYEQVRGSGGSTYLRSSTSGLVVWVNEVPEPKTAKNRAHIDFDAGDMETEVERLVGLGGSVVARHNLGDFRWTIVADPEGNEFCVTIR